MDGVKFFDLGKWVKFKMADKVQPNRLCKFVTRLLESVYPEMVYTDDV